MTQKYLADKPMMPSGYLRMGFCKGARARLKVRIGQNKGSGWADATNREAVSFCLDGAISRSYFYGVLTPG